MKKTLSTLLIGTLILASVTACGTESGNAQPRTPKSITQKPVAAAVSMNPATQAPAAMPTAENEPSAAESASSASLTEQFMSEPIVDRQIIDWTNADVISLMDSYKSILKNESAFIDSSNNKSITIRQLADTFAPQMSLSEFTIIDLDYDNLPEVVLAFKTPPTDYGPGYVEYCTILHYQDDNVYSYSLPHRAFESLKIDGTFSWAGSASHHGFGKIIFNKMFTEYADLSDDYTYCDARNNIYVVNCLPATEEEFYSAADYERNKPDVTWHECSEENIELYF